MSLLVSRMTRRTRSKQVHGRASRCRANVGAVQRGCSAVIVITGRIQDRLNLGVASSRDRLEPHTVRRGGA